MAVSLGGCSSGDDDDDTDIDAGADGGGEADAAPDSGVDASVPGPCGGTDALTVHVTMPGRNVFTEPQAPANGVELALDCGEIRLEATTDETGDVVFEGLDLAAQPVDVTAFHPDTNAYTVLGITDAAAPLEIALTTLGGVESDFVILAGDAILTDDDASSVISISSGGGGVFDYDGYRLGVYPVDPERLVGIEYVVDDADQATLLSFFDTTFPAPVAGGGEGPVVTYAPATFDTTTIEVTALDPRLAARTFPSDDPDRPYSSRASVGGLVYDLDTDLLTRSIVGFTTHIESVGDTDTVHVSWRGAAIEGTARTVVRTGSQDLRVGAVATRNVAPDAIGPLDAPVAPSFVNIVPEVTVVLSEVDIGVNRPDWCVGDMFVTLSPEDGGEALYGSNSTFWTISVPEGVTGVHMRRAPGGRPYSEMLGAGDLRIIASCNNGVDAAEGVRWTAFDARYHGHAE